MPQVPAQAVCLQGGLMLNNNRNVVLEKLAKEVICGLAKVVRRCEPVFLCMPAKKTRL